MSPSTRRLLAIVLCMLAGAAMVPTASGPLIAQDAPRTPIEDPMGIVLPRIRAALAQSSQRLVRLSVWGASHTASDQFTGMLRARLQARYGDGGPGAFMPASAVAFYERRDVSFLEANNFSGIHGLVAPQTTPLGMMGMALDARGEAVARFVARHELAAARVRVFSRGHPIRGDGRARVSVQVGTARAQREMGSNTDMIVELEAPVTPRDTIEIRASRARIFGISIEARTGVVVDSFGVSGARAEHADRWEDASFQSHVAALAPDVVFIAYGTNESSGTRPVVEHRRSLESVIDRLRRAAPTAPCVVIGPSNYPIQRGGGWIIRPRSAEVRDTFRAAAIGRGCGFFDLIAFQGGPSNLESWFAEGLVLGDRVHMTDAGHERLAAALERAILGP